MAVMNPCCCKLQLGVSIVAIVNMGLSLAALVWYLVSILIGVSVALAVVAEQNSKQRTGRIELHNGRITEIPAVNDATSTEDNAIAVIGIFILIITVILIASCLITFVTSVVLLIGASKRQVSKCRLWFMVTLVFLIIYIFFKIFNIGVALWAWEASSRDVTSVVVIAIVKEVLGAVFSMAIEGYQLWVVYAFIDELKQDQANSAIVPNQGVVHYVPKPGDQPPPYANHTGYTPYSAAPMHRLPQHYNPMSSPHGGLPVDTNFHYK